MPHLNVPTGHTDYVTECGFSFDVSAVMWVFDGDGRASVGNILPKPDILPVPTDQRIHNMHVDITNRLSTVNTVFDTVNK